MVNNLSSNVKELINKSAAAEKSDDAMRFSQAACSVAHAIRLLNEINEPKTA